MFNLSEYPYLQHTTLPDYPATRDYNNAIFEYHTPSYYPMWYDAILQDVPKRNKVIIAGSRGITNYNYVLDAIESSEFDIDEVVSGNAMGVDRLGERWARENNKSIRMFIPEWDKFGKSAGYKRNVVMAEYADALIAVYDGVSKGTKHMINIAFDKGLEVFIYEV